MRLNYFTKLFSSMGRWLVATLICVSAITFVWQGAFFSNTAAMADPVTNLVASADVGDQAQDKVREDTGRTKNFIRDTANKVERTANKNADRVSRADDNGGYFQRRANKDAARIHQRAEEDTARTQKAVDNTKNAVERAIEGIKDTFD